MFNGIRGSNLSSRRPMPDSRNFKKQPESSQPKRVQTEGLWVKCESCKQILWKKDLEAKALCCTKCGFHFKMPAKARLEMLFDDGQYLEHDRSLASTDPLDFRDTKSYQERLKKAEKETGLKDAAITGEGRLDEQTLCGKTPVRHGISICRRKHGRGGGRKDHSRH